MNKKAQGLSMQTIVIAILVLLVVVVVALVFTGGFDQIMDAISNLGSCESKGRGASCIDEDDSCPGVKMKLNCPEEQVCCMPKG